MTSSKHDASYKLLFSYPEVVRDLVLGFIPDEWLHSLDFGTLEKVAASFVTDDYRHRADDIIWRVKVDDQWMYLYLLIEFQSRSDPWMAVRVMTYVGLLYQDLIRRDDLVANGNEPDKSNGKARLLPPVLPIVVYNGEAGWQAATDMADLIPKVPGLVANYLPRLKYLLVDESRYADKDLVGLQNIMAAIIRIERPASQASLLAVIDQLNVWLEQNPELKRTFAIWIRVVILRQSKYPMALPKVQDLKELKMTLAERFDQWALEYKEEGEKAGIAKGIAQGEALLLQRLLARRFGPLPATVLERIAIASTTELETWGDRVLDAVSLDDVFSG